MKQFPTWRTVVQPGESLCARTKHCGGEREREREERERRNICGGASVLSFTGLATPASPAIDHGNRCDLAGSPASVCPVVCDYPSGLGASPRADSFL
eukprot:366367-Chlamydomonas_euryale.AAC.12